MTPFTRLLLAFALTHVVFASVPAIDLWVSHLFYDQKHFPLDESEALSRIRFLFWYGSDLVAIVGLILWPFWHLVPERRVRARVWGFVGLSFLLGPFVVTNQILKGYWGRARPDHVTEFGGADAFTPPFQIANQCAGNCSFVSGEASAASTAAIVVGVLAWPHLGRRGRTILTACLTAWATLASGLRVATGRHFFSDVIFAGFLMAFVILALYHLLGIAEARQGLTAANFRHDLRLLRSRFRRG